MADFPTVTEANGKLIFTDGTIVLLPKEYKNQWLLKDAEEFYANKVRLFSDQVILEADPLGFCSVSYKLLHYTGLVVNNVKGVEFSRFKKKYPLNRFEKNYIIERIKKEYSYLSFEEVIPIQLVTQNLHEIRNLNSKISGVIDGIINAQDESEWEEKFDQANENVKKVYVGSRLIKFLLDNISFLSPNYFLTLKQNESRSFVIHRSVHKIVKIYREDFKKKKSDVILEGSCFKKILGDKELFEVVLMLLIENAIKYSSDISSIAPKVLISEKQSVVIIKVSSFGLIIPEEERPKLFTRGFRSEFQKNAKSGTGMGLHNAKEILKVFKCEIEYKAQPVDKGDVGWNHFIVTCPNAFN